jgi:hypothetical protein
MRGMPSVPSVWRGDGAGCPVLVTTRPRQWTLRWASELSGDTASRWARSPGEGVKFHRLRASPILGPASSAMAPAVVRDV